MPDEIIGEGCVSFTQPSEEATRRMFKVHNYPRKPHMKFRSWREMWALYKITEGIPALKPRALPTWVKPIPPS
jgi:hypothetical protein